MVNPLQGFASLFSTRSVMLTGLKKGKIPSRGGGIEQVNDENCLRHDLCHAYPDIIYPSGVRAVNSYTHHSRLSVKNLPPSPPGQLRPIRRHSVERSLGAVRTLIRVQWFQMDSRILRRHSHHTTPHFGIPGSATPGAGHRIMRTCSTEKVQ